MTMEKTLSRELKPAIGSSPNLGMPKLTLCPNGGARPSGDLLMLPEPSKNWSPSKSSSSDENDSDESGSAKVLVSLLRSLVGSIILERWRFLRWRFLRWRFLSQRNAL
jgi:hypothetical protein